MGQLSASARAEIERRYQSGEWRGFGFRDCVLNELAQMKSAGRSDLVALDIGCGHGFDGHPDPQRLIGEQCTRLVGIEPDKDIKIPDFFSETHYCTLEESSIAPNSVDVAFAVMVLEHVTDPDAFVARLHKVLKPGGVFWGFTVDARHWFSLASNFLARTKLKDKYLTSLHGSRGEERYENYPVAYKFNRPDDIARYTKNFAHTDVMSLWKKNQTGYYFPGALKFVGNGLDALWGTVSSKGSVLVVRMEK
jgi:SAM-dependent methyltransferase